MPSVSARTIHTHSNTAIFVFCLGCAQKGQMVHWRIINKTYRDLRYVDLSPPPPPPPPHPFSQPSSMTDGVLIKGKYRKEQRACITIILILQNL